MILEEKIFELCTELYGQYAFMSDGFRTKVASAMVALRALLSDEAMKQELDAMLAEAQEDARLGRGDAEIEDFIRDAKLARAQSEDAGS